MRGSGRSYSHFMVIGACLCFVYVFGLSNLKSDPITSFSEWNSLRHLNLEPYEPAHNIPQILASIDKFSSDHAPLYFILLRFWRAFAGRDLFTYRLLSVFFGLLTLAVAYRLALLTRDNNTALDAVLITAFLAFLNYFTHEVRMYSLLPMLAAFVAWSYWKVISAAEYVRWWQWLSLTIASAAIVYVHYFSIMVLAAIGLYHLLLAPKNRRWFGVCLAMIAAGVFFLPWLPVALKGLSTRAVFTGDSLSLIESVRAIFEIYTNGISLIVPVVAVAAILRFKRLDKYQKYILFLAAAIFLFMILLNGFAHVLFAARMRYTIVLAMPWACALAIGLGCVPRWRLFRLPFAVVWILSFFLYTQSDLLSLYTNEKASRSSEVPHYEDFVYQTAMRPRRNEPILSFHPFLKISQKIHQYYAVNLREWKDLIHIYYDDQGALSIQSWQRPGATLPDIAAEYDAIWVIHNPQKTDLNALDVYTDWFSQNYQLCKRYFETADSIIEYYVRATLPCELLIDDRPFAVKYDNGTKLANVVHQQDRDQLRVYFWWQRTRYGVYALTLQIFDSAGSKVDQIDKVIGPLGPDVRTLSISSLPKGDYVVKLIVYDRSTMKTQAGAILEGQQRFARAIDLVQFSIGA